MLLGMFCSWYEFCTQPVRPYINERRQSMLVNRRTFIVKKGCTDDVVKLLLSVSEGSASLGVVRVYVSKIGPGDMVAWEAEFKDLDHYAKYSAEWAKSADHAPFLKKFNELVESGGVSEIWMMEK